MTSLTSERPFWIRDIFSTLTGSANLCINFAKMGLKSSYSFSSPVYLSKKASLTCFKNMNGTCLPELCVAMHMKAKSSTSLKFIVYLSIGMDILDDSGFFRNRTRHSQACPWKAPVTPIRSLAAILFPLATNA
eukprot:CAMPEP_0184491608 /NCGR_PEP_ID=MMETSP0113_2-20130426/20858_1 /TAXON_ID=91329 /ORGANISM="Norrisiella sphaerica, Strain BC52" /LENGTH=132 /DNA_ID=CAMNT_0026876039 /DNA_START=451 /DNA_END=849 /DNA_ORIENTATION=+